MSRYNYKMDEKQVKMELEQRSTLGNTTTPLGLIDIFHCAAVSEILKIGVIMHVHILCM